MIVAFSIALVSAGSSLTTLGLVWGRDDLLYGGGMVAGCGIGALIALF